MKGNKKLVAMLLSTLILLIPLVYANYVNDALNHKCNKSMCHICQEVQNGIKQLNSYEGKLVWATLVILPLVIGLQKIVEKVHSHIVKTTLITLKIELII